MAFKAILTTLGLQRLAEAQANYTPLVFTEVAVGDGGGSAITPVPSMTALVNETARVDVNSTTMDPDEDDKVRVEGLFPVEVGGFTIREAGLFNLAGEMIAIASYPEIYKPTPAEGASVPIYIRIPIRYANADEVIEITVDNTTVMATREDVEDATGGSRYLWENFV